MDILEEEGSSCEHLIIIAIGKITSLEGLWNVGTAKLKEQVLDSDGSMARTSCAAYYGISEGFRFKTWMKLDPVTGQNDVHFE